MTSDVNVSDPAKVEAKNKNFAAGTDAGYCDSSAQGFFLVRLALGHPALLSTKPQPPPALSFSVPKDEEILTATPQTVSTLPGSIPALLPRAAGIRLPSSSQLFPSPRAGAGSKAEEDFSCLWIQTARAMNCKGQPHLCPLQLPLGSKLC